jgi:photosystem II stability/assembly factor-like uncharacterized protein
MLIKFGSIITEGVGKLGGSTITKSRSGIVFKNKMSRVNSCSEIQVTMRQRITLLSKAWSQLLESQRTSWNIATTYYPQRNYFGDTVYLSGYNLYLKINLQLLLIGQSVIDTAPVRGAYVSIESASALAYNSLNYLFLSFSPTVPTDFNYKIYASPGLSPGKNYCLSPYRFLGILPANTTSYYDLSTLYLSKIGYIGFVGQRIFIKIIPVNQSTGIEYLPYIFSIIIQAASSYQPGTTWTDLGQQYGSTGIWSIAYLDRGICLAGTGNNGKILRSTNYGATWSDLGQQFAQTYVYSLAYLGNGICLAGTYPLGKILRSTDYGATWSDLGQQFAQTRIYSLAYLDNGICLAGTNPLGKILRSTDYGATWSDLGQQAGETAIFSLAYIGVGICLAGTGAHGKILRSTDYGVTWTDLGQQGAQTVIYSFSSPDSGIVLCGGYPGGRIQRSTNYGATWTDLGQQYGESRIYSLAHLGASVCIAGTGLTAKILQSTDYGATWTDLGQQASETTIYSLAYLDNGICLAGTGPNGKILRSIMF